MLSRKIAEWTSGAPTVTVEKWNPRENTVSYDRARYTHSHTAAEYHLSDAAADVVERLDAAVRPPSSR